MANTNVAFGMRPIAKMSGAPMNHGVGTYTKYEIASDNSNKIYQGMPVIPLSTGFIDRPGNANGGIVPFVGVFYGCEFISSVDGKPKFSNTWQGSGADTNFPVKAFVYDDPHQLFAITSDATLTNEAGARAAVFANAPFGQAQSGSDTTGISLARLAVGSIATTQTLPLRIMGWQEDVENSDFTLGGVPLIVRFNNHFNAVGNFGGDGDATSSGIGKINLGI